MLHRDETPSLPQLPQAKTVTSEGVGKTQLEGTLNPVNTTCKQKLQDIPTAKTTITPVPLHNTELHPALYKQRTITKPQVSHVQHTLRLHSPRRLKNKRIRNKKLEKLIKEYTKIAKDVRIKKPKIFKPLPSHISKAYAPTPKSHNGGNKPTIHPMQL